MNTPPVELVDLWTNILSNINYYTDVNSLRNELDKLKTESDYAMEQFKELLIKLTADLANVTKDNLLNKYKNDIINAIQKNPKNVTDSFILQGYNKNEGYYRKQLVLCNEDFLLNHSFNEITHNNTSMIDRLFQFKTFWNKLKPENKEIIKYYLLTLCYYADIRYINFNKYLELKKLHTNCPAIFAEYDKII